MSLRYLLNLTLAATIGATLVGLASLPAEAQGGTDSLVLKCTSDATRCEDATKNPLLCPKPAASTYEATGTPLASSTSGLYFKTSASGVMPLLGQSYDYLCHVCQPNFDDDSHNGTNDARCTLKTFPTLFGTMENNQNNVIRLEAIFNHSPGTVSPPCCKPYLNEQPFTRIGSQWDLDNINSTYLTNLDAVVKAANLHNILVEVTLFDPWDPNFGSGPFNPPNIYVPPSAPKGTQRGFGQQQYFASFTVTPPAGAPWSPVCGGGVNADPWTKAWVDAQPYCGQGLWTDVATMPGSCFARHAQAKAIRAVVEKLKHNTNVIWEVANEPENFTNAKDPTSTYPGIVNWEQWVVSQIIMWDPKRDPNTGACIPGAANHQIQINGHYWDKTTGFTTSAWAPNFSSVAAAQDLAASLHYTFNWNPKDTNPNPGLYGAIDFWRPITAAPFDEPPTSKSLESPALQVGFNEGRPAPGARTDDGARAEALEFIMYGGARYDGYSLNYQDPGAQAVSVELSYLAGLLKPTSPEDFGLTNLDKMRATDCNNGDSPWCFLTLSGSQLSWGALDEGTLPACLGSHARFFYSTMSYVDSARSVAEYLLYVHHGDQLAAEHGGYSAIACGTTTAPGYQFSPAPPGGSAGLQYSVPIAGCYLEYWQDPQTGSYLASTHVLITPGQVAPMRLNPAVTPPLYREDVLLLLKLLPPGNCGASPLTARFVPPSCTVGRDCVFDASNSTPNTSINYIWDWGDETPIQPLTNSIAHHTFSANGTRVVTLEVTDSSPADASFTKHQVSVSSKAANPSFTATCAGPSCTFGNSSTAGDFLITIYSWNFGDPNSDSNSDPNDTVTSHTYPGGGSYDVTLTVTDSNGVMATSTQTITVLGPPIANFSANCQGLICVFDASGTTSDSPITSYSWTFGDGGTGSVVGPTHTYGAFGTYTVTLTVTDSNGQTGTTSAPVTTGLIAGFTFSCPNMTCSFYSTAVGPLTLTSWTWDFGDGTVVTNPSSTQSGQPELAWQPQYTYAAPGLYTVTLTVTDTAGNTASIALAVLVNMPPVANPDSVTTVRDTPVTIDLLANDSDPDGDALTFTNVSLAAYPGAYYTTVQLANGRWGMTLTPPNAFVGTMTFSYQACDKWGACSAPATITVTVTSAIVNALGDQFYCPQNTSIQIPVAVLLANDYQDNGLPLHIVSYDTSFLMGTLVCTSTVCTYTPPTGAAGFTQFHYTIADTNNVQDTAPVRIYVGVKDQAPTANDIFLTTTWNSPVTFTITDIAFKAAVDSDGDTLTIGVQSQKTAYGTLVCSTPMYKCTYTPNTGYAGTDRFLYTASDMINPPVTAAINVLTLPSPTPTFDTRGGVVVTGQNQSAWISSGILANDYLPNGGPETVTSFSTAGLLGSLNCGASGCTYTPYSGFVGTTSFTYTATDSHGATDSAIVKICVGCTNHAPVATPQKLSTSATKVLKFSVFDIMHGDYDPDNDPLFVTVYTVTAKLGTLSCGSPQYWCTYTPNGATGTDVITYVVSDGQAYVTSTLTISVGP